MASARRTAAVVTVSDGVAAGTRDDGSGRALVAALSQEGFEVVRHDVVPDERERITEVLEELAAIAAVIVTTGGTGLGPRDVTPEATRATIDREAPGLAEAMRAAGRASTPFAALSREVVGARGSTLIVNLPGSEKGATESLSAIMTVLPHALDLLGGDTAHGPSPTASALVEAMHADEPGPAPTVGAADPETELVSHRAAGDPVVLVTAVRAEGTPPCKVGQKILLGPEGPIAGTLGCAEFDAAALTGARRALQTGEPTTETFDHELGSIEVYVEPVPPKQLLLIFAATPVAAALVRWSRDLGFEPSVVEPRAERRGVLPAGTRIADRLGALPPGRQVFAVHTDHDAPGLAETLAALLRTDAAFIGVMGSARHMGPHVQALRDMGFDDADLARVRSPVGLNIGARTAEEIALSILAGVVAARRGGEGGWLDR
jgi:molybdopterin adenylyltransferase